jgi:hypothetical protein
MDGVNYSAIAALPSVTGNWYIDQVADFNGDRKPDLLWRDTYTEAVGFWFMDHTNYSNVGGLPAQYTNWKLLDVSDFDGNRSNDLLWVNPLTGEVSVWFLNQGAFASLNILTLPGNSPDWVILGKQDLDNNGSFDLIAHNYATGEVEVWLLNGTQFSRAIDLPFLYGTWDLEA